LRHNGKSFNAFTIFLPTKTGLIFSLFPDEICFLCIHSLHFTRVSINRLTPETPNMKFHRTIYEHDITDYNTGFDEIKVKREKCDDTKS